MYFIDRIKLSGYFVRRFRVTSGELVPFHFFEAKFVVQLFIGNQWFILILEPVIPQLFTSTLKGVHSITGSCSTEYYLLVSRKWHFSKWSSLSPAQFFKVFMHASKESDSITSKISIQYVLFTLFHEEYWLGDRWQGTDSQHSRWLSATFHVSHCVWLHIE